jgi:hypothetical protein
MKKQTESKIQQAIVQYLSLIANGKDLVYFSIPNEAWGAGRRKKILSGPEYGKINELKKMGMLPGCADLCIVYNEKAYFIEVKTDTGKQSQAQILFMDNVLKAGCEYAVCRSVDDVKWCLKEWGVI